MTFVENWLQELGRDGAVPFLEPIKQTNDLAAKAEDEKDCSDEGHCGGDSHHGLCQHPYELTFSLDQIHHDANLHTPLSQRRDFQLSGLHFYDPPH